MALKQGLLGLLNYGEMTGYELARTFTVWFEKWYSAKIARV